MLIINKNIAHNIKRCNTPSKNFLFFFFPRVLHQIVLPSLCLRSASVVGPLFLRFKSVPSPLLIRSYEWEENGTYIGVTREEEGSYGKSIVSVFVEVGNNLAYSQPYHGKVAYLYR